MRRAIAAVAAACVVAFGLWLHDRGAEPVPPFSGSLLIESGPNFERWANADGTRTVRCVLTEEGEPGTAYAATSSTGAPSMTRRIYGSAGHNYYKSFAKTAVPDLGGGTVTAAEMRYTATPSSNGTCSGVYVYLAYDLTWSGTSTPAELDALDLGVAVDSEDYAGLSPIASVQDVTTNVQAAYAASATTFTAAWKWGTMPGLANAAADLYVGDEDDNSVWGLTGLVIEITYTPPASARAPRHSGTVGVLMF